MGFHEGEFQAIFFSSPVVQQSLLGDLALANRWLSLRLRAPALHRLYLCSCDQSVPVNDGHEARGTLTWPTSRYDVAGKKFGSSTSTVCCFRPRRGRWPRCRLISNLHESKK